MPNIACISAACGGSARGVLPRGFFAAARLGRGDRDAFPCFLERADFLAGMVVAPVSDVGCGGRATILRQAEGRLGSKTGEVRQVRDAD
jgi:hypothetical protein